MFDFEAVAQKKLHYGHVAFLAGSENEGTYRANREGFEQYQLRVRRLVDISKIDMSVSLFGIESHAPIILCPCGGLGAFHPDGEVEVARALKVKGHEQALSTFASKSIEEVTAATGGPVWFQLYFRNHHGQDADWNKTLAMIRRAEASGSPVLVWTVDRQAGTKRLVRARAQRKDRQFRGSCHQLNPNDHGLTIRGFLGSTKNPTGKPMWTTEPVGPPQMDGHVVTWDSLKRLTDATTMKVVIKGIVTREDAELALEHGADGVWISNHGGREENSLRSTVECVPEVAAGVAGRAPIIVDSGFRRGTDIFKGLALGATAVGVGRPYIFGLAAFGHAGVETTMDILAKITKASVLDRLAPRAWLGSPRALVLELVEGPTLADRIKQGSIPEEYTARFAMEGPIRNRGFVSLGTFAVAIMLVALAVPVSGQTGSDTWAPPRTPDGQPDLQGIWTNETITAFERPATLADKAVLTKEEARALEVQNAEQRAAGDGTGSYNEFWKDPGTEVVDTRRTSLVVDPPDGRVALRPNSEATRDHNLALITDSWDYMSVWDRCITRGVPGSMFPTSYNNAYQIVQIPGYVVIRYEMIHDVRVIPLDGRRHVGSDIRSWMGDSRGRWEGNTLVVETTHYNNKGWMWSWTKTGRLDGIGVREALRVVERFTRVDEHTLNWEVTVKDPNVYTRPWTLAMPLKSNPEYQIYEYACHEGNWAVRNTLGAARAQEAADEAAKTGSR